MQILRGLFPIHGGRLEDWRDEGVWIRTLQSTKVPFFWEGLGGGGRGATWCDWNGLRLASQNLFLQKKATNL